MRDLSHISVDALRGMIFQIDGIIYYSQSLFTDLELRRACVKNGKYRQITLPSVKRPVMAHRVIWALETGSWPTEYIDHIDGDGQNNRFDNLREATPKENARNRASASNSSSKYIGVSWDAGRKKWRATIQVDGRTKCLGRYDDELNAAAAYKRAADEFFGEYVRKIGRGIR